MSRGLRRQRAFPTGKSASDPSACGREAKMMRQWNQRWVSWPVMMRRLASQQRQQTIGQLVSLPGKSQQGTADQASASDLAANHDAAVGQSARERQELTTWQAVSWQRPGPAGQQKQRSSSSRHSYRRARKHAARKQLKTRLSNEEALLTG